MKVVSIITPTFNRVRYLEETIQSVQRVAAKQAEKVAIEHVIVDDGCTDGTIEMVGRYPVVLVKNRGKGPAAARNTGIQASRGDYIAFLDDDDIWLEHHLESHLEILDRQLQVGLVFSQGFLTDEHLENRHGPHPAGSLPRGDAFVWALSNDVPMGSFVIRRSVLDQVGTFDETLVSAEDCDLLMRISAAFDFYAIEEATILWRQHPRKSPRYADWARRFAVVQPMLRRNYRLKARVPVRFHQVLRAHLRRRGWHAANTIVSARQCLDEQRPIEAAKFLLGAFRSSPLHCTLRLPQFWHTALRLGRTVVGGRT